MRFLLAGFGDAGHTFPIVALALALRARGHEVAVETAERWRAPISAEGLPFHAAPEFIGPPERNHGLLAPLQAVAHAVPPTRELIARLRPDAVVSDVLTLAPALAAELEGVPVATLVPHVDPRPCAGHPPYALGAELPATALGRWWWRRFDPVIARGSRQGRDELNETRRRVGLPPQGHVHNGINRRLALIATFPQLEYPRPTPLPNTHVVGPLTWDPRDRGEPLPLPLPDGDPAWPLVIVAPSTAQDPDARLVRAAVSGLRDLPLRVLISGGGRGAVAELPAAPALRIVDWLPYARAMAHADVVICHGGHGTLAHALAGGAVPVVWPIGGDMGENAARAAWSGAGVHLPRRLLGPRALRFAVARALGEPSLQRRARELAAWMDRADPGTRAATLVEALVTRRSQDPAAG